jgi:nicotinamide-nucleotide amidase
MLEQEILPRILAAHGQQAVIRLKRFHSYGLGESHVDALLNGVEALVPDGSLKLGFRAHYPQLETKLTMRGLDKAEIEAKLAPVEHEVRRRMGHFIIAEDDETLEGVVLRHLTARQGSLAVVETLTSGQITSRIAPLPGAETIFRRGTVARSLAEIYRAVGMAAPPPTGPLTPAMAEAVAVAARHQADVTHALAVLVDLEDGEDRIDLSGTICIAIATGEEVVSRRSRIAGGREWVRLGAMEMGLDSLRRYLQGLPVHERIDFEKVEAAS